jgi:anaerobic selenocysteine-containing dehydrogenase
MMAAAWVLAPLIPDLTVEMSAFDANPRGLFDGMPVRLVTSRGTLEASVVLRDGLTPGTVVVPDVDGDGTLKGLLGGEVSVPVTVERAT